MNRTAPTRRAGFALAALALLTTAASAQDWTDEQLLASCQGFLATPLVPRLQQMAELLGHREQALTAMAARIHGDHREYLLKIERLLAELSNERWAVREQAERTLVEVGARARAMIQTRAENYTVLEEGIRCQRILAALSQRGTEQEDREIRILRGLVMTALHMPADPRLLRALRSALGHTDPLVVDGAIRALGAHGGDEEADAVRQMLEHKGGIHRSAALAALAMMRGPRALALCRELVTAGELQRAERVTLIRILRDRTDASQLLAELAGDPDPVVAKAAALNIIRAGAQPARVRLTLADRTPLEATLNGFVGDGLWINPPIEGLPTARVPFGECEILDFPDHAAAPARDVRVFLAQGSLVTGRLVQIDPVSIRVESPVFGQLTLPRDKVQGLALDPDLDRLVGASADHDRVRLRSNQFVDGNVLRANENEIVVATGDGERVVPRAEVAGVLLMRPRTLEQDATVYTRIDLTGGDRILGFVAGSGPHVLAVSAPLLGAVVLPITQVTHIELGVGGGAMWGFTLIADYSDNKIVEVDDQGQVRFELGDMYGVWDAECLDNNNLLVTEFSVSRVREVTRKGETVWQFEDLKNPYDADRLPNGNTLIADTFNGRVIEIDPNGSIVWKFDDEIRPFDCDRLANGNTLIADVLKDRVIEVSPAGEVVWEVKGMNNVHDADRLPNGNTLITLRSKGSVVEVDKDGRVVWELNNLSSPSDADRLPNGNTIVAENNRVEEFDRRGNLVWKKEMTWAVEVNRY